MPQNKKKQIKAVIFDCGGVLIAEYQSSSLASFRLHNTLIKAGGRSFRDAAFSGKISEAKMWRELNRRLDLKPDYTKHLREHLMDDRPLDQKIFKLANKLKKTYKVAIISDGVHSIFWHWAKKYGFEKVFPTIVLSADVKMVKPKKYIFNYALKKIGVRPEEAIFIDDLQENVIGARSAGLYALRYNPKKFDHLMQGLAKHGVKL